MESRLDLALGALGSKPRVCVLFSAPLTAEELDRLRGNVRHIHGLTAQLRGYVVFMPGSEC